jgi:hypothetical protein
VNGLRYWPHTDLTGIAPPARGIILKASSDREWVYGKLGAAARGEALITQPLLHERLMSARRYFGRFVIAKPVAGSG